MELIERIRNIEILGTMSESQIHQYYPYFNFQRFKKGDSPFNHTLASSRFYFITKGILKVYKTNDYTGREHTLFILKEQDVFDVVTLLDNKIHKVATKALADLEVVYITLNKMQEIVHTNALLFSSFMPHLAKRIRMLEQQTIDISLTSTFIRLVKLLIDQKDTTQHLSHEEIASLIGTTRAVANRHLQEIKKSGIIDIKRKQIIIKDLGALKNLTQDFE